MPDSHIGAQGPEGLDLSMMTDGTSLVGRFRTVVWAQDGDSILDLHEGSIALACLSDCTSPTVLRACLEGWGIAIERLLAGIHPRSRVSPDCFTCKPSDHPLRLATAAQMSAEQFAVTWSRKSRLQALNILQIGV